MRPFSPRSVSFLSLRRKPEAHHTTDLLLNAGCKFILGKVLPNQTTTKEEGLLLLLVSMDGRQMLSTSSHRRQLLVPFDFDGNRFLPFFSLINTIVNLVLLFRLLQLLLW